MSLRIDVDRNPDGHPLGTTIIALGGSLDTATSTELELVVQPLLAGMVKVLIFDLEELEFVSSAGIRVILHARKQLGEQGGKLALMHLQPQIQKVIEIIKALPGVNIFKDVDELDAYLADIQRQVVEGD